MVAKQAFSLIEMLIAVVLMSLLIGVAIVSFKHQLLTISKTKKIGINKTMKYKQLKSSLESMKYYVISDYNILNQATKNLYYYFNGTKDEINYITESPLFSSNIALVKIKCHDNKLSYKEEKLYSKLNFLQPKMPKNAREITLYSNLDSCEFNYIKEYLNVQTLENSVPDAVIINTKTENTNHQIYVKMKNDNNLTKVDFYNTLYGMD